MRPPTHNNPCGSMIGLSFDSTLLFVIFLLFWLHWISSANASFCKLLIITISACLRVSRLLLVNRQVDTLASESCAFVSSILLKVSYDGYQAHDSSHQTGPFRESGESMCFEICSLSDLFSQRFHLRTNFGIVWLGSCEI